MRLKPPSAKGQERRSLNLLLRPLPSVALFIETHTVSDFTAYYLYAPITDMAYNAFDSIQRNIIAYQNIKMRIILR